MISSPTAATATTPPGSPSSPRRINGRPARFAPDAYFSNDRPGSVVIFCRNAALIQLVWSNLPVQTHLTAAGRGDQMWIDPPSIRAGTAGQPGNSAAGIAEVLREHGLDHAAVGVLGPDAGCPAQQSAVPPYPLCRDMLAELRDVTFKQVAMSLMFGTACFSAEELAVVRHCAAAGNAMSRPMLVAAAPGVTEAEMCAAGTVAALRYGCQPNVLMWSGPGFVAWARRAGPTGRSHHGPPARATCCSPRSSVGSA